MMMKAQENKASITKFAHLHPKVRHLILTNDEWKTCKVMECVLEPFYNHTRSVSKAQPCLLETIGIIWGLDDLLDNIQKRDGQFSDVGDDIRAAFKAGVETMNKWLQE